MSKFSKTEKRGALCAQEKSDLYSLATKETISMQNTASNHKTHITFSDVLSYMRLAILWRKGLRRPHPYSRCSLKIPKAESVFFSELVVKKITRSFAHRIFLLKTALLVSKNLTILQYTEEKSIEKQLRKNSGKR